jgi:hypothetical protein
MSYLLSMESVLCPEIDIATCAETPARIRSRTAERRNDRVRRQREVGMVEQVEKLDAKLQAHLFCQLSVLADGKVQVGKACERLLTEWLRVVSA